MRALLVSAAWWVLVEGNASAWSYGIPIIIAALVSRAALAGMAGPGLRWGGAARFAVVFVLGLVRGGFDIARRALSPTLPLSPDWVPYDLRLTGAASRRLLVSAVSVIPGTIGVDLEGSQLRIHALVTAAGDPRQQVKAMEDSVARAFGEAA